MLNDRAVTSWQLRRRTPTSSTVAKPAGERRRPRLAPPFGATAGLAVTAGFIIIAAFGPWLAGADPARQDLAARLIAPVGFGGSLDHPLGTDALGRDLLARVIAGARLSLLIGAVATLVAGTIGVALGLVAGFGGGLADRIVTWWTDVQLAVPFVIVAIAITATLGNGVATVVAALAITGWVGYAKVVRLQAHAVRGAPWVEAARSLGLAPVRIAVRHVIPNLAGPIVILATQQVAGMILYEAALSYLGLGVGGNTVTWGGMVADGQEVMATAWWVSVVPGAAIVGVVFALNAVGDWLSTPRRHRG